MKLLDPFVIGVLLAMIVGAAIIVISKIRDDMRQKSKWEATPTLDEYLVQHPECKTPQGIKCAMCNSRSIKNWGLSTSDDTKRIFICNHCGATLYRRKDS